MSVIERRQGPNFFYMTVARPMSSRFKGIATDRRSSGPSAENDQLKTLSQQYAALAAETESLRSALATSAGTHDVLRQQVTDMIQEVRHETTRQHTDLRQHIDTEVKAAAQHAMTTVRDDVAHRHDRLREDVTTAIQTVRGELKSYVDGLVRPQT